MKRVGVPRLAAAADEASLITATTIQQQSGGTSMHTLTQQAQQPIIGAAAMLAVGGQQNASGISSQFVRAPSRPQQQQVGVGGGPAVINYSKAGGVQYAVPPKQQAQPALVPRHKQLVGNQSPGGGGVQVSISSGGGTGGPQFQRLKVEDALSYLDQVKYKFNNQPQVYNDFLDIMKEFKSQSIDTPGVITRVSNLFKGHPELIVGFNTFLPPGYKIEVQANGQGSAAKNGTLIVSGIAYQVSVSMPSPTGLGGTQHGLAGAGGPPPAALLQTHSASQQQQQQQLVHIVPVPSSVSGGGMVHNLSVGPVAAASNTLHHISQAHQQIEAAAAAAASHHGPGMGCSAQVGHAAPTAPPPPPGGQPVEFNHAIEYVNKIKSRFSRQPDKYKRFLEILHAYQRGQRDLKEPLVKQQTEQEVYAQVAKLFENQDDLLAEFGQFLPDASGKGGGALGAPVVRAASPPAPPAPPPAPAPPPSGGKYGQERQQERQQMGAGAQIAHHHQRSSLDGLPGSGNAVQGDQTNASETYSSSLYRTPPLSPPPATHHHQQISTHQTLPKLGSAPIQQQQHHHLKRSPSFTSATNQLAGGGVVGPPPPKKARPVCPSAVLVRDVSYAEAAKYGTLADFGFFDKVRKALRSQDVYDNFLRCLLLFTNEIISKSELLTVTAPFLSRHRELQRWLQEFLGPPASPPPAASAPSVPLAGVGRGTERAGSGETAPAWGAAASGTPSSGGALSSNSLGYGTAPYASTLTYGGGERYTGETRGLRFESLGALGAQLRHDRPQGDAAMDVDLSTCKRLGTSYCALPRGGQDAAARRCSGRTPLCRDVLNDTWVSFPTWSEDSTFVTCRKTQYEEYMYRCEDERFELDVVIETNASTIRVLEGVHKKLSRMGAEEAARFRLDDCLGGSSATIHQRALRRIYGDKVATDIIAGLKKNPVVAVPVVLRRLKAKEEEWREAQKGFNKQWREQNEKYYLKSLDHQGINFKQNDLKALRSKSLFNDIETAYEERRGSSRPGPDLSVEYGVACGPDVLRDAAELLIHHVRRQTAIQKAEKRRIKQLLRQFVPDLFGHPRQPLSDDERDDDDKEGDLCGGGSSSPGSPGGDDMPVGNQVKQEKNEVSSESDTNNSERGGGRASTRSHHDNHKNNNNNAGIGDVTHNAKDSSLHSGNTRRSSGGVDGSIKTEPLGEPTTPDDGDTKDTKEHIVAEGGARTFVCTTSWYLFLRLHGVLCARLAGARRAAAAAAAQEERDARLRRPSTAVALKLKPSNVVSASEYYTTLLELVRGVLDGNVEACALEDAAREMLGIRAYPVYTLDKVVSSAVRQLQHCVSERASVRCAELASRGGDPATYRRRAHRQLRDQQAVFLVQVYGGEECRVTFELVEGRDGGRSASPPAANMTPSHQSRGSSGVSRLAEWSRYNDSYACPTTPTDSASNTPAHRPSYYEGLSWCGRRALFLRRNRIAVAGAARFANGARTPPSPAAARAPDAPAAGHARRKPAAPRAAHARSADGAPRCDKCGTVCGGGTQDVGGALQVTPCRLMHAYKSDYFEFKRCRRTARKGGAATRQMQAKVTSAMSARWRRWLRAWAEQHIPPNARDKLLMPGVNNSICGVSSSHGPPECATDR